MKENLRNLLVMIELELRRLRHDRTELYFRAVQPILWIAVFGPVMSKLRGDVNGVPYTDFIAPGVMIQSTTFASIFFGLMMVWERDSGILKKLLVTPTSRYAMVIGRSMASGVRAIFQALMIVPIALLMGVRFVPNIAFFAVALAVIFFSSGGFAAISILVASFGEESGEIHGDRPSHNHATVLRQQCALPGRNHASSPEVFFCSQSSELRC